MSIRVNQAPRFHDPLEQRHYIQNNLIQLIYFGQVEYAVYKESGFDELDGFSYIDPRLSTTYQELAADERARIDNLLATRLGHFVKHVSGF